MSRTEPPHIYFPHRSRPSNIVIDHSGILATVRDYRRPARSLRVRGNAFQDAVFRTLSALNTPGTGGGILRVILRRPGKRLRIRPVTGSTPQRRRAYVQPATVFDARDSLATHAGPGPGSTWTNLHVMPRHYLNEYDLLQVTMVHELAHAGRAMTGTIENKKVTGYYSLEEYLATIVGNVFCSERYPHLFAYGYDRRGGEVRYRFSGDRDPFWRNIEDIITGGHAERAPMARFDDLSPDQAKELSRRFIADVRPGNPDMPGHGPLMRSFRDTNPILFEALRLVRKAPFNPMRDLS